MADRGPFLLFQRQERASPFGYGFVTFSPIPLRFLYIYICVCFLYNKRWGYINLFVQKREKEKRRKIPYFLKG